MHHNCFRPTAQVPPLATTAMSGAKRVLDLGPDEPEPPAKRECGNKNVDELTWHVLFAGALAKACADPNTSIEMVCSMMLAANPKSVPILLPEIKYAVPWMQFVKTRNVNDIPGRFESGEHQPGPHVKAANEYVAQHHPVTGSTIEPVLFYK